jgi:DNA-binding MarR family transcriptional regulator
MIPRSTIRDIATRTYVDKAQVSRAVAVLEDQELLARFPRALDRRSPTFDLTSRGRKLMDSVIPLRLEADARLAEALGTPELRAFESGLDTLIALASAWNAAEPEMTMAARRRAVRQARSGIYQSD